MTATELFAKRVDVESANIEMAFRQLMGMMLPRGGSGLRLFDGVEKMSLPVGKAVDGVEIKVREVLVQ